MALGSGPIESRAQFKDTPQGLQERWTIEIQAARENVKKFHSTGDKVVKRYLDERENENGPRSRLNLFHSTVVTQRALLYGKQPTVDVDRRFADADDDDLALERIAQA